VNFVARDFEEWNLLGFLDSFGLGEVDERLILPEGRNHLGVGGGKLGELIAVEVDCWVTSFVVTRDIVNNRCKV